MHLIHSTIIKNCVYGIIGFVISGILFVQAVKADEAEVDSPREEISQLAEFLGSIPEYSKNLYIGPLRLYPSLDISETYDDNVFNSTSRDIMPHNDFYETYIPKIALLLPIRDHSIAFDYGFEIFDYHDNYKLRDTEQDHVNRIFGGSIDLNFANGFSIRLSDRVNIRRIPGSFTRRTNPIIVDPVDEIEDGEGEEEQEILEAFVFNTFTRKRQYTNNVASIFIDLPDFFDKLDFSISYANIDSSYKGSSFRGSDRNTNVLTGTVMIKPLPKTDITTGFLYNDTRYDNRQGADNRFHKIPFNIIWRFTPKSHFFLNSNYNWRNYGSGNFADFHGYNATLGYRFNATERDNLTIKFERSLREQQFQRESIVDLSQDPPGVLLGDGRNNPQHWTQIGIDYIHQFPRNFSIVFSPAWQRRKFRDRQPFIDVNGTLINKHQEIDSIRMGISGRYTAPNEWLFGEMSYNYSYRDSNFPNGDLVKNVAAITVGLRF